jgi:hypothetical protein
LLGPTDDYFTYKRWFEASHGLLVLPADCVEVDGPVWVYSNQFTWSVEWCLVFKNDPTAYIRIREGFAKRSRLLSSRRLSFAYHYGPIVKTDDQGVPEGIPADPVFVRIDNVGRPPHLHHEGDPTTHIPQEKINGLALDDINAFDFINAAFRSRTKGTPVATELGYRIGSK